MKIQLPNLIVGIFLASKSAGVHFFPEQSEISPYEGTLTLEISLHLSESRFLITDLLLETLTPCFMLRMTVRYITEWI